MALWLLLHRVECPRCTSRASTGASVSLRVQWKHLLLAGLYEQSSLYCYTHGCSLFDVRTLQPKRYRQWIKLALNKMRNFLLKSQTTNQEPYACLLSCLHTNMHPYTHSLYFIREVKDRIITCLTTTIHAEMLSILLYFLKVFHGMMIHKNGPSMVSLDGLNIQRSK